MSELVISNDTAFSAGASLWMVADLEHSEWAERLDWYLNFQIIRANAHAIPDAPLELKDVIQKWEFDEPKLADATAASSPLMIASSNLLPNHATVVVPLRGNNKSWASSVYETWKKLGAPSLRIFLPRGLSATDFASAWPGSRAEITGSLVTDPS